MIAINYLIQGVKCHVQKPEDRQNLVQAAIKHFSRIDVLINNAGVNPAVGEILGRNALKYLITVFFV